MKASFLDLRRHMNEVIRAMEKNEAVTLTYRGKVKGVIYPAKRGMEKAAASHPAFGIWKDMPGGARAVDEMVDELRKGRHHVV